MSSLAPLTNMQWEAVGAWQGGTVVNVAVATFSGKSAGLLASSAGVLHWSSPATEVKPLPMGMSDLHVIAVAWAGGSMDKPATALAATATGRLFRLLFAADSSEQPAWQEMLTWAGLGVAVVLAPSPAYDQDQTLFVGTPAGIFRTQDDGQSWESCNFGLLDEDVLCLACAPNFAESEVLWAGTAGGGLYRSRNSGRAWRESGYGLPDAAVQSLAISPNYSEDRTLYAGMEGHGVYVSHDGGENWQSYGLSGYSVNTLACAHADLLWAGTENGLMRIDNDEAVQVIAAGETVMSVAATAEGQVAAGCYGSGLWLTMDGHSEAQAMVWRQAEIAVHAPPVVANAGDDLLFLDSDGFMAHSADDGATWLELESAPVDAVLALAAGRFDAQASASQPLLFAATASGLVRWEDETAQWQPLAGDAFAGQPLLGIALSPHFGSDQTLLATTATSELLLSQDGGAAWRTITGPWRGQSLLRADFAPANVHEVLTVTVQPDGSGHYGVTLWHSVDLGQQWELLASLSSDVPALLVAWPQDSAEHAIFLAIQHRLIKIFHDDDPTNLRLHQHFFDEGLRVTALSLAPDYTYSRIIWAATSGGLYRSVDGGMSWGLVLDLPLDLPVVWLDVSFSHVQAITLGGRAWRAAL